MTIVPEKKTIYRRKHTSLIILLRKIKISYFIDRALEPPPQGLWTL